MLVSRASKVTAGNQRSQHLKLWQFNFLPLLLILCCAVAKYLQLWGHNLLFTTGKQRKRPLKKDISSGEQAKTHPI